MHIDGEFSNFALIGNCNSLHLFHNCRSLIRKIIHIDMDAFFASIEQRDNPRLRGCPVAVGRPEARGVVAAASYEARKFGVFSAMPSVIAQRKCPHLIFVPPRFDVYKQVSETIMDIFKQYTPLVEPLSIDEAYLDVTTNLINNPSATLIARDIKHKIFQSTQLTASAGISINKFLAKTASDQQKPDGLFVIEPAQAEAFIARLPIKKFYGVGEKTAIKMHQLGIFTGHDLKQWTLNGLVSQFGKAGHFFYQIARGIDNRPVMPERERKSVGIENTFQSDIKNREDLHEQIQILIDGLWRRVERFGKFGRTTTLKIKYENFEQHTKSRTLPLPIQTISQLTAVTTALFSQIDCLMAIRLMGLTMSGFDDEREEAIQLTIDFDNPIE
jgi:DNA polymerase IV